MTAPAIGAVFLSYASQDAEAAKRICVALRAAGVEVWFDQNELRGGDAWDQKIKRQIKECTLFMPVISANTNARAEGYFRLEWKLAVDRSHLMADDAPFLFPVVIDAVADAAARVPDRFREVQWTRLGAKDRPETLAARVVKVLAGEMEPGRRRSGERAEGATSPASAAPESPARLTSRWIGNLAAIGGILIGLVYALRPHEWGKGPEKTAPPAATAPATRPVPAVSEARQLVAKARALYEPWDFASREDFLLAEQLLKRAADLDPADGEVCAAQAVLSCGFIVFNYDSSAARQEVVRSAAERAIRLAPDSPPARFARAFALRFQPGQQDESLRLLREEAERQPDNRFVGRNYGAALRGAGHHEEALVVLARVAALPGGDAIALYNSSMALSQLGRPAEAEVALDQAIALRPNYGQAITRKILLLLREHGDVAQARKFAEKIPPDFLLDDRGAASVTSLWLVAREPERCLAALATASDYMQTNFYTGLKAYRTGLAHRMAGRPDAAVTDWRAALQVVEQRLRAQPNSPVDLGWKALLLALVGEKVEAERVLRIVEQFNRAPSTQTNFDIWKIYVALSRYDPVLRGIAEVIPQSRSLHGLAVELRYSPEFDPLRDNPHFQELLKMLPPEPTTK